jgi:hypothetical protein
MPGTVLWGLFPQPCPRGDYAGDGARGCYFPTLKAHDVHELRPDLKPSLLTYIFLVFTLPMGMTPGTVPWVKLPNIFPRGDYAGDGARGC